MKNYKSIRRIVASLFLCCLTAFSILFSSCAAAPTGSDESTSPQENKPDLGKYSDDAKLVLTNNKAGYTVDLLKSTYNDLEKNGDKPRANLRSFSVERWTLNDSIGVGTTQDEITGYFGTPNRTSKVSSGDVTFYYIFDRDGKLQSYSEELSTDYLLSLRFSGEKLSSFGFVLPKAFADTGEVKHWYDQNLETIRSSNAELDAKYKEPAEKMKHIDEYLDADVGYLAVSYFLLNIQLGFMDGKSADSMRSSSEYGFDYVFYDGKREDIETVLKNMLEFLDTDVNRGDNLPALASKLPSVASVQNFSGSFEEGHISFEIPNMTDFLTETNFSARAWGYILSAMNDYKASVSFTDTGVKFEWNRGY